MRDALRNDRSAELLARVLLTLGAVLTYWPLLTFRVLLVTDDGFMSDIWNGELPPHVLVGEVVRSGGAVPTWTSQTCSGAPLIGGDEPLSLALFSTLPAAAALCALLLVFVLVAAHGGYDLARRLGASRPGAWLAGYTFASSGYIVTQLKHLAVVGTVVWLPLALALLDRAFERTIPAGSERVSGARRTVFLSLFGLVWAQQVRAGFPQSAYICALLYGAFALFRVLGSRRAQGNGAGGAASESFAARVVLPLTVAALAVVAGTLVGAKLLLPLSALGAISDRQKLTFEFATQLNYWPRDIVTFLFPYANGDIANGTYRAPHSLFWEDYGYVGAATCLLAIYAVVRGLRDGRVRFFAATIVLAYLMVLGPATPFYRLAFEYVPGMGTFRFPTRFLILVELGLCMLAALGLTRLPRDLLGIARRAGVERVLPLLVLAICAATELDLVANQGGQNPMVDAATWWQPPATVEALRREPAPVRIYTPMHMDFHRLSFFAAHGWENLAPFYQLRDLVQPNSNLYWNVATADCYAGISPRWYVDVWGDHSRGSTVVYRTLHPRPKERAFKVGPEFIAVMRTYGVTHVLSPFRMEALEPALPLGPTQGFGVNVYRIPDSARVRIVRRAEVIDDLQQAAKRIANDGFEPDELVVLSDVPASLATPPGPPLPPEPGTSARIEHEHEGHLKISANAPSGGFLVIADTFFPGWQARVDGKPAPIYRANVSLRAVPLTPGWHRVELDFELPGLRKGRVISTVAMSALLCVLLLSLWLWRRQTRT